MLKIQHPIIQGGMHYVGYAELAAAVSNAGGLGVVTALTQANAVDLRAEIRKCKAMTDKPFGVNLTILPMFKDVSYDEYVRVIIDEGIKVVETAGRPPTDFIDEFKANDVSIIHKCVTVRHAKSAVRMGADAISLDGFECAGHPGEEDIGNWILQAMGARELEVPFLTSGGVGNGSQLAAALALGADGINMGTRFMATTEAPIHHNIKQALVDSGISDTTLVMRSVRNTERVFKNDCAVEVQQLEAEFPGQFDKIHHLVKGENYKASFLETGDITSSVWSCGPVVSLIDDIPTCQELIDRIMLDAEATIGNLNSKIV
jgi:nitronate monooxygenase